MNNNTNKLIQMIAKQSTNMAKVIDTLHDKISIIDDKATDDYKVGFYKSLSKASSELPYKLDKIAKVIKNG